MNKETLEKLIEETNDQIINVEDHVIERFLAMDMKDQINFSNIHEFAEEDFSEMHAYDLGRRDTLKEVLSILQKIKKDGQ